MEKDSPSEGITALAGGGSSGGVTGQPNAKPAEAPKQRMMNPEQFLKRQQSFLMNSDANKNPREHVLEVFFNSAKITNFETFGEPGAGVLSASFSPSPSEDKYIAASKGNGEVDIYSLDTCKKKYTIRNPQRRVPFTMVKWRPRPEGSGFCTNNVLGTVNTDGQIQHWHMATGKCISTIPPEYEEESQLFGLDYSENARKLVVCGQYPVVRVFDTETGKKLHNLGGAASVGDSGHSNRVYAAKFYKDDDSKIVSGGWDNKIVIWDLKAGGKPVHTIHNRLVCGDAIDILKEGLMISCSWQEKDQIQMYDITTYRISTNYSGDKGIDWDPAPTNKRGRKKKKIEEPKDGMPKTTYLCTVKADREGKHFLAGGAVKNEARVFVEGEVICKISGMVREVLTCDWNYANDKFLIAGADGFIRVFNVNLDEYDKDRAAREEMEAQGVMIQYAK